MLNKMNIFKPLKIEERISDRREELTNKGLIVVDESTKTLTFKSNMNYIEYVVLCTFYKDYLVDVKGHVNLNNNNLSSIDIQFNSVGGDFYCSFNKLRTCKMFQNITQFSGNCFMLLVIAS